MNIDVVIRRAADADLPAIGRLGALLVRVHHAFDPLRFMQPGGGVEEGYAWFLGTQLNRDDSLVLVAERGDDVVAYLYAGVEPRSWKELRDEAGFVHDILVAEGHRNTGIAEALMTEAFAWARSRGLPRMVLWTATPNERALRLFERLGFRSTMIEMTCELDGGES
jgi:ribosomal protein S18 acetylase RimI-like enzyme